MLCNSLVQVRPLGLPTPPLFRETFRDSSTIFEVTFLVPADSIIAFHFSANSPGSNFKKGRIWNSLAGLGNPSGKSWIRYHAAD